MHRYHFSKSDMNYRCFPLIKKVNTFLVKIRKINVVWLRKCVSAEDKRIDITPREIGVCLLELADAPARGLLFDPPRPETSGQPVSTRVRRIAAIKSEFGVEIIPPQRVTLALEIIQFVT